MPLRRELQHLDDELMLQAASDVIIRGVTDTDAMMKMEAGLTRDYDILSKIAPVLADVLEAVGLKPEDAEAAAGGTSMGFCILAEYGEREPEIAGADSASALMDGLKDITDGESRQAVSSVFSTILGGDESQATELDDVFSNSYWGLLRIAKDIAAVLEHCSDEELQLINPELDVQSVALGAMAMGVVLKDIAEKRLFKREDLPESD
jgi:hypothetical protein